jgi:hypothetical protein
MGDSRWPPQQTKVKHTWKYLKSAFEQIFNVMQLILVKIK